MGWDDMSANNNPRARSNLFDFLLTIPQGTEILASEVSKKYNLKGTQPASRILAMRDDMKRIGKGVFVKL
jgi:hypothetical protein